MKRALLVSLVLFGCSGGDAKKYDTYQLCFDDKVQKQMKAALDAIVECCLDHDIGGAKPPHCGADEPECINFLTANLKQTDADITVKMQSCTEYVFEKNKM